MQNGPLTSRSALPGSGAVRRIAAGALMTTVLLGVTTGPALADSSAAQAATRPSLAVPSAGPASTARTAGTASGGWPVAPSSVKATAVRLVDRDQGVVQRAGTATRIAAIWAIAATVAMAGMLAGSVLRRP
jgi:hypothetical protein